MLSACSHRQMDVVTLESERNMSGLAMLRNQKENIAIFLTGIKVSSRPIVGIEQSETPSSASCEWDDGLTWPMKYGGGRRAFCILSESCLSGFVIPLYVLHYAGASEPTAVSGEAKSGRAAGPSVGHQQAHRQLQ
jgi:hypothetical protein